MLKVTDTGVTIGLQSQAVTPNKLTQILWVGIAIAVVGLLMAFKMLSVAIGSLMILLAIIAGVAWQALNRKKEVPTLTGGELRLTQQGFSHHQGAKVTSYQFLPSDSVEPTTDGMIIYNADGLTLYHITGFHDPKHITIAQAVLQGKPIKTQSKAIKLQST
ncbi:hypothetical protein ZA20_23655 [Salmonella enterica subsp. enterica serovar Enteritidis]|nr:hypothetical protein [Salmonella enterica subsp. enterica serovar Enteritidis]